MVFQDKEVNKEQALRRTANGPSFLHSRKENLIKNQLFVEIVTPLNCVRLC